MERGHNLQCWLVRTQCVVGRWDLLTLDGVHRKPCPGCCNVGRKVGNTVHNRHARRNAKYQSSQRLAIGSQGRAAWTRLRRSEGGVHPTF